MTALEQWLSDATRGLSAESAAQVRAEIEQHYDSACEAGDDAIAALGDPRTANRAYRQVLLTEYEAMAVPVLTQRKRQDQLPALVALVVFALSMSGKHYGPIFWPGMLVVFSTMSIFWFFPPKTLERCRIYAYVLAARNILFLGIAWRYIDWTLAVTLSAGISLVDYFFLRQRLSILRKLAAGQTWSLLPQEPRLTHVEAITRHTSRTRCSVEPRQKFVGQLQRDRLHDFRVIRAELSGNTKTYARISEVGQS